MVSPDDIDSIVLVNKGKPYELVRDSDGWIITVPRILLADMRIIRNILDVLNREKILKVVATDTGRLGEFGLKRPVLRATFRHDGESEEFLIGRKSPTESGAYMYKQGLEGVFLVSLDVPRSLNQGLYKLRRKEPFVFDHESLERIVIEKNGGSLEIAREDSGWFMESPYRGKCGEGAVSALVNSLRTVYADEFFDGKEPDPSDYGDSARITMYFDDGSESVMDVYFWGTEADKGIVLYQRGYDYFARTNQRQLWKDINADAGFFLYRTLFDVGAVEFYEIEAVAEGKTIVLKRKGDRWLYQGRGIGKGRMNEFFDMLNGLEAESIIENRDFTGGERSYSLVLKGKDGSAKAWMYAYGEARGSRIIFDSDNREIKKHYAESSNLDKKVLVTNLMIDDLTGFMEGLTEEVSE
jgi:hypothetical protein